VLYIITYKYFLSNQIFTLKLNRKILCL